ncbi:hypothetical protein [Vibrio phage vB_VmeM-Yong XC32]|nr:hypothetical protein [Vibrio phage vB_VmeM-Yong XC31]QAX96533.1 hypothetical protein [Vibrio phage vB_VmeM-Yong XC32]QAX96851.1 hypothetical protein [Vibrio phage vB_VmeM-Yong MS31]QAX97156.1 hypothetical protein [Vibrio phage vB_VmeM-Yong MS32]
MPDGIPADSFIVTRAMQEYVTALAAMQRTVNLVVPSANNASITVAAHKLLAEPGLDGFSIAVKDMQDMIVGPDMFYRAIPIKDRMAFPNSILEFKDRDAENVRQIFRNVFTGYIRYAIETTELCNHFDMNCYTKEITPHRDYEIEVLVSGSTYGVRLLDDKFLALEIPSGLSASVVNALVCGVESSIDINLANIQGAPLEWEFLKESKE